MREFSVWAPNAKNVRVEVNQERFPMSINDRKWWTGQARNGAVGTNYAFRVDESDPLPDPRSPWQPEGVHGPSRVVDHTQFRWTDEHWQSKPLASALIYELHVGTFTPGGTFESTIDKLEYLVDLGVTHVELMPIIEFPGSRGWGYDGVNLFAPHHAYGGPDGLKRLVDACHANGLGVILDVVYNHLGPEGNYLNRFGPYFTGRYHTPWGDAVNFDDKGSDEIRRFFCDNVLMWLRDYHFDGLRLDAVHAFKDGSAVHILEQFSREVKVLESQLRRHLVLIGESDLNDPRIIQPWEIGGYGLDAQWSDDFHHALHSLLTGERNGYYVDFGSVGHLAKALQGAYVVSGDYSQFRQRHHGRPAVGVAGHRFLAYMQNHDQIGNRAEGERTNHLVNARRVKIGAAIVLTSPFVPMLFEGEEWAASTPFLYFTNYEDPDLGKAVSEGRRREFVDFGWNPDEIPDPQDPKTFEKSKLKWDELTREPHVEMLDWYRRLIRLRRSTPALSDGNLQAVKVHFNEQDKWLIMERGPVTAAVNFSDKDQKLPLSATRPTNILLASDDRVMIEGNTIALPSESVVILG